MTALTSNWKLKTLINLIIGIANKSTVMRCTHAQRWVFCQNYAHSLSRFVEWTATLKQSCRTCVRSRKFLHFQLILDELNFESQIPRWEPAPESHREGDFRRFWGGRSQQNRSITAWLDYVGLVIYRFQPSSPSIHLISFHYSWKARKTILKEGKNLC